MRNYFISSNQSSINNFSGELLSPYATHGSIIMGDATHMGDNTCMGNIICTNDATCMDDVICTTDSARIGKGLSTRGKRKSRRQKKRGPQKVIATVVKRPPTLIPGFYIHDYIWKTQKLEDFILKKENLLHQQRNDEKNIKYISQSKRMNEDIMYNELNNFSRGKRVKIKHKEDWEYQL